MIPLASNFIAMYVEFCNTQCYQDLKVGANSGSVKAAVYACVLLLSRTDSDSVWTAFSTMQSQAHPLQLVVRASVQ